MEPRQTYLELMQRIRERFDVIEHLRKAGHSSFSSAETAAFHGRKIVEGIAFACLVAVENGLISVPRDAKGQWNAEAIFKSLSSKGFSVLPSPSQLRTASAEELAESGARVVVDGIPDRRLSHSELVDIYQRLHGWLHEANPYVHASQDSFMSSRASTLWSDLAKIRLFMERHFIAIRGEAFYCVLWDSVDGHTKVGSLSKIAA